MSNIQELFQNVYMKGWHNGLFTGLLCGFAIGLLATWIYCRIVNP